MIDAGESIRRKVFKLVNRGDMTEEQAETILQPLMSADEGFISHGGLATSEAMRALSAFKSINRPMKG